MDIPCQFCKKMEAQLFFKYNNYEMVRAMCRLCYANDLELFDEDLDDCYSVADIEADDYVIHSVMDI